MTTPTPNIEAEQAILRTLQQNDWTLYSGPAIALKTFSTAVGPREAVLWLSAGDGYNRTLSGNYLSEGNNVISSQLIPVGADAAKAARLTQKFVDDAEQAIGNSYAARLLRA